jgi:hypothetical protein
VSFYPLAEGHIIANNPQSEQLYRDPFTAGLFRGALGASKMIPDNKATQVLLAHLAAIGFTEETWIKSKGLKQEIKYRQIEEAKFQERHIERFLGNILAVDWSVAKFTPEEEKRARKEFEDMILSVTEPNAFQDLFVDEGATNPMQHVLIPQETNEQPTLPQMQYVTISSESSSSDEDNATEGLYLFGLMQSMGNAE